MVWALILQAFRFAVRSHRRKNWLPRLASATLSLTFPVSPTWAQQAPSVSESNTPPSVVIDLSAIGYREPSTRERLVDDVNGSLDFIDDNHVLLTFDRNELLQRDPKCPSDHDDRLMHAVVLEIPSGKIITETDWYLHDRRRYVWPLGEGEFLLRRLNTLYLVDSSLQERVLLESPKELLWVSVTPDRKQVIVETQEQPAPATSDEAAKNTGSFVLRFLDIATLKPERTVAPRVLVMLDGTSTGYVDALHKGDVWLIRYGPSPQDRRNIARVRARDVPRVLYSSNNSLLIGRCCSAEGDYSVTSFTVSGHRLWKEHWPQYRHHPAIAQSLDGGRFAVSTVIALPGTLESPAAGEGNDGDIGLQQNVQVIESATGAVIGSVWASPIVISGENFSLSPDGRRLAVLSSMAVQIYDLPAISREEQARAAALKADAPELSAPPPAGHEETTAVSAEVTDQERSERSAEQPSTSADAVSADAATSAKFQATTRAVLVDVVVTDAKGHLIHGLHKDDFEVSEDGKIQDIRSFHEATEQHSNPTQDSLSKIAKQLPNVFTNSTQSPEPAGVMMILLDLLNTPVADQQFAREELAKFLGTRKTQTSQFALSILSGDPNLPLRLVQGFTPDENLLLAALNKGKATPSTARWQVAGETSQNSVRKVGELTRGDTRYNSWQALLRGLQVSQEIEQSVDMETRVRTTTDAMVQLATYLGGIPGRKSVVWLSGSFPIALPVGPIAQTPATGNHNYARLVQQISNMLAKSQVAVYPVEVRGVDAGMGMSAGVSTFTPLTPPKAVGIKAFSDDSGISPYQQQSLQEMSGRLNEHIAFDRIASATGGKAFYNANAIEDAISTASEQASNYYTISYSPSNKNYDGRFRKIRVSLPDKQLHSYYRPGYFADDHTSSEEIAHNIRVVAMQYGSPQSRQIHFSVEVVPADVKKTINMNPANGIVPVSKKSRSSTLIEVQRHSIDYAVSSSDLRFVNLGNGSYRTSLSFMIASFDSEGRPLTAIANASTKDLSSESYREVSAGGFRVHQEVDVPTAATSLRIGVQDRFTGYMGTVDIPLPVPPPPDLPRIVKHQLPEIEPN